MSDRFVTVATYNRSFEAQLAKNLLENEGIASLLHGELTADMMPFGQAGGGDQIVLQVHEDNAQRAAGILAAVAAAKLDDNWEEEAEAGVWLCSICGEAIGNRLSICYSCQTPRDGIRSDSPRPRSTAIQEKPSLPMTGEEVQKRDEIVSTVAPTAEAPPTLSPPPTATATAEESAAELSPTPAGDDLARRAFVASWLGVFTLLLLPLAWYYLLRAVLFDGKRSPQGARHLFGALLVHGFFALIVMALCAGGKL